MGASGGAEKLPGDSAQGLASKICLPPTLDLRPRLAGRPGPSPLSLSCPSLRHASVVGHHRNVRYMYLYAVQVPLEVHVLDRLGPDGASYYRYGRAWCLLDYSTPCVLCYAYGAQLLNLISCVTALLLNKYSCTVPIGGIPRDSVILIAPLSPIRRQATIVRVQPRTQPSGRCTLPATCVYPKGRL